MGSTELESVTSCVSSRRSNQLSYEPSNCERTGVQRLHQLESVWSPPGVQNRKVALLESKWRPNRTPVNHCKLKTGACKPLIS